jgi:hypothetical protein
MDTYHVFIALILLKSVTFSLSEHLVILSKSLVYALFADHNIANLN